MIMILEYCMSECRREIQDVAPARTLGEVQVLVEEEIIEECAEWAAARPRSRRALRLGYRGWTRYRAA